MHCLFFVLVFLVTAACSPTLDVGRPLDARQVAAALDEGLSSQADVLEAFGWPDSTVRLDDASWRFGDPARGLPPDTDVVWSYYHIHVANRFGLAPGPLNPESHLVRFYFAANGLLLGWDQSGTGGPMRPLFQLKAPASLPESGLN